MATAARRKPAKKTASARKSSRRPIVVDFHTHVRVIPVIEFARANATSANNRSWKSKKKQAEDDRAMRDPQSKHTNPKVRLRDMDKMGVDIQVVSMNMPASVYSADGATGQKVARLLNDGIAEFVAHNPDRFVGIGSVPMQDPTRAAKELDYAINTLGLAGVSMLTNIAGRDLGEQRFNKFWAKAEALGAPIFIHPQGFTHPDRLQKHHLVNTIGQPLEEALAMASLIHEGVLDAYPKLKISIAHGGGYLPFYAGRDDQAYKRNPLARGILKKPPSAYMKQLYYDTVIFDELQLEHLVSRVGANRVLMGSDYPWVPWDAVNLVKKTRKISKDTKERILWKNASRFLGLGL